MSPPQLDESLAERVFRLDERCEVQFKNIAELFRQQLQVNETSQADRRQMESNFNQRCREVEDRVVGLKIDFAKNVTGKGEGSDRTWSVAREILSMLVALAALVIAFFHHA
jgi:hypothetical protein